MKKQKLTCPNCGNYVFLDHNDELMKYFLATEKVGHECSVCKTKVVISENNISYVGESISQLEEHHR